MKTLFITCIIGTIALLVHGRLETEYQRGYREATAKLLKTNPPSEELEMTCAGLWVGEQNRKHWERINAR